jgi:hypothetical protein
MNKSLAICGLPRWTLTKWATNAGGNYDVIPSVLLHTCDRSRQEASAFNRLSKP